MNCPSEFIWAQYVDGEPSGIEAAELQAHLESCLECRKQVVGLEEENRVLAQSLQDIEWWAPENETVRPSPHNWPASLKPIAVLAGTSILLRAGIGFVRDLQAPSYVDWLSPLSFSGLLNWFANGLFWFIGEGRIAMIALITQIGFAFLSLFSLGVLAVAMRRFKGIAAMVSAMALMFALVVPGHATEVRRAEKGLGRVVVAANETVDDTLVVFADTVDIDGTITGDLVTFGRRVDIRGTVRGNLISFAQRIALSGNVGGDIMGFAQSLQIAGSVGNSLWGFAQNVTIPASGKLERDAIAFASEVDVEGTIGRDLYAMAGSVDVGSRISRDFQFRGGQLRLRAPSTIGRNLDMFTYSEKNLQIDSGVVVQGKRKIELEKPRQNRYLTTGFYFWQLIRIIGAFIAGLILFWLFPSSDRIPLSTGWDWAKSGGVGFLALVAAPIGAIILAITLIGLPIALTTVALWLLGLYLAKILVGRFIGKAIFKTNGNRTSAAVALLFGITLVVIAVNLPYIGGILNFLMMLVGLGGLVLAAISGWRRRTAPDIVSPA
jgi:cytoskeletal protein CcmA (bactofilin family)